MIRQTTTGMEQFCDSCAAKGEPHADCWLPLTDEFFPRKYRGATRVSHFIRQCRACRAEARAALRKPRGMDQSQECAA